MAASCSVPVGRAPGDRRAGRVSSHHPFCSISLTSRGMRCKLQCGFSSSSALSLGAGHVRPADITGRQPCGKRADLVQRDVPAAF